MKIITDDAEILDLLPLFAQTIIEDGSNGETIEHGHVSLEDGAECTARIIYALPDDGNYDEDGEFLGNWDDHIVRMEIDEEGEE